MATPNRKVSGTMPTKTNTTNTSTANMATAMNGEPDSLQQTVPVKAASPVAEWRERQFRAMNTTVDLTYFGPDSQIGAYVENFFERSEQRFSRFRPSSELVVLNDCDEPECDVSAELFELLEAAKWANRATNGLFEPAVLDQLERAGYDRSFEQVRDISDAAEDATDPIAPAYGHTVLSLHLDSALRRVRRPVGLRIDLGGIGKGWTVDRCADFLHVRGPFLLNAGGDLYAYGTGGDAQGWEIEIEDARQPENAVAALTVSDAAVATSTVVKRHWQKGERRMHHIIDPRPGRPAATDVLTATVVASRVAVAEVYAKSALILGSGKGPAFLAERGVEGVLQTEDGTLHATSGIAHKLALIAPDVRIKES